MTGPDVLGLQPRVTFEDGRREISGGEHSQDMLYSQAATPNNRFSAKDLGVDTDTLQ